MLKKILWFFVQQFFKVYFSIVGKPTLPANLKKTLSLYEDNSFFDLFSLIRAWDAPFSEVNKLVPKKGLCYDLGCGDGTQSNFLALSSDQRKIVGIELNGERVIEADKGVKNTRFQKGNILKVEYKKANAFVLTHVLHHLPTKNDQIKLLKLIKPSLKKDGKVIIVEIIRKPFLKYVFTWITDAFIVPILFEHSLHDFNFHYRSLEDWKSILDSLGYKYKISFPHSGKPFSHVIIECTL